MNESILIICRSITEVKLLSRIRYKTGYRYILASDNPMVHQAVKQYPRIRGACWLEQAESFYAVASKVIEINKTISELLVSLNQDRYDMPSELLAWMCVVEGGMTTQRIQDLLLLINSYLSLIDTYNPAGIVLLSNPDMLWEDRVLIHVSKSRGIHVNVLGRLTIRAMVGRLQNSIKYIARLPYHVTNLVLAKIKDRRKSNSIDAHQKEILFQLCGSNDRHVENIIPIMMALKNRGYYPIALCWKSSKGAGRIRGVGLHATMLERYIDYSSILISLYLSLKILKKARKRFNDFSLDSKFCYRYVSLRSLLWPSILFFFFIEFPQRYILNAALKKFFRFHSPVAIKLWCGGAVTESDLVVKNLTMHEQPLFMHWVLGVFMDDPYESTYKNVDLFLANGSPHQNYLMEIGVSADRIEPVGMSRYDHLNDFIKNFSPLKSRILLNIPSKYSFYILHDAGAIMRGYYSTKEQMEALDVLMKFARQNPSVALLVKPHPSHPYGMLEYLIDRYSLKNTFMIDKNILPYHAINATDLVITKYSTLGLEAMIFERAVISLILDNESRFKIFGDAVEYIMDADEFHLFLTELTENTAFRSEWMANQKKKQKEFLKDYFPVGSEPAAEISADAIDRFIRKNQNR